MNLREDKHWAYGAYSGAGNAKGQRPWMAFGGGAERQDRSSRSASSSARSARSSPASAPVTEAEVAKIRASNTLSLPGGYETASALLGQVASNLRYGRPHDYVAAVQGAQRGDDPGADPGRGQDHRSRMR